MSHTQEESEGAVSSTLVLANLRATVTEVDLLDFFGSVSEHIRSITFADAPQDPKTGAKQVAAMVEFSSPHIAMAVHVSFNGRRIRSTDMHFRMFFGVVPNQRKGLSGKKEYTVIVREIKEACAYTLQASFAAVYGSVTSAFIPTDNSPNGNGAPRGFGFVRFTDEKEAKMATKATTMVNGKPVVGREHSSGEKKGKREGKFRAFVAGLPPGSTEDSLRELIGEDGTVVKQVELWDMYTPNTTKAPVDHSRMGYVDFGSVAEGEKAVAVPRRSLAGCPFVMWGECVLEVDDWECSPPAKVDQSVAHITSPPVVFRHSLCAKWQQHMGLLQGKFLRNITKQLRAPPPLPVREKHGHSIRPCNFDTLTTLQRHGGLLGRPMSVPEPSFDTLTPAITGMYDELAGSHLHRQEEGDDGVSYPVARGRNTLGLRLEEAREEPSAKRRNLGDGLYSSSDDEEDEDNGEGAAQSERNANHLLLMGGLSLPHSSHSMSTTLRWRPDTAVDW